MKSHFTASFFTDNRHKLRELLPEQYPILVVGHGLLQRTADTTYPFAQESNFWYLTGLTVPDLALYIDKKGVAYLLVPELSDIKAVFDGSHDETAFKARSGISHIVSVAEGLKRLERDLAKTPHLYTSAETPAYDVRAGTFQNPAARRFLRRLKRTMPRLQVHDSTPYLTALRVIKQPAEIAAMTAAIELTVDALSAHRTAKSLKMLGSEYAFEAALTHDFRVKGSTTHAYSPIVASGKHATTLHYIENSQDLRVHELTVVDVGAEVEHYAADITRTVALSKPTTRQQAVLDEVLSIQSEALSLLQPGLLLKDYERAVVQYMGQALKRLRLIKDPKDITQIRRYYPHATSHFLGLDVHDVGDYDAPLEEGMVLTCEPGIYIPEEGIGVRIEDDVLLTAVGHVNLSGHCAYDAYVLD